MDINKLMKIRKELQRVSSVSTTLDLENEWEHSVKKCEFIQLNLSEDDPPKCHHENQLLVWCDALTCPLLKNPLPDIVDNKSYTMTDDEIEAAIYNWLHQSGTHVIDQFPGLKQLEIIHKGVVIQFKEDAGEI